MKFSIPIWSIVLWMASLPGGWCGPMPPPPDALADAHPAAFVHPGILHTREDFLRMKQQVRDGVEPWASAWKAFLKCPLIRRDYQPSPLAVTGRDKKVNLGQEKVANDMSAAYYNAIAWEVSGDPAYAQKAAEIIDAWSSTCKQITGSDAILASGIYGYKVANAAEILRATYPAWPPESIARCQAWLKEVWYPVIKDLADANWGTCCIPTILSIGVFCDDHAIFTAGINAYRYGGEGKFLCGVTQYISPTGQDGESGRDQVHAQGGVGHLAEAAEIAWNQGIDLYGYADDRLLAGFEYMAKYNLGFNVPFDPAVHRGTMGPWAVISAGGRGRFSPVYEMVWNHYGNRRHLAAPFTQAVAMGYRPETWSVDHPGIGTLTFTLLPTERTPLPAVTQDTLLPATPGAPYDR
jgi:hypothetical protein